MIVRVADADPSGSVSVFLVDTATGEVLDYPGARLVPGRWPGCSESRLSALVFAGWRES